MAVGAIVQQKINNHRAGRLNGDVGAVMEFGPWGAAVAFSSGCYHMYTQERAKQELRVIARSGVIRF